MGWREASRSATVRSRVEAAQARQRERQGRANARLTAKEVDTLCQPDEAGSRLLRQASVQLDLSARAWHRILKVARTVADLADSASIRAHHVAEAIQYRRLSGG